MRAKASLWAYYDTELFAALKRLLIGASESIVIGIYLLMSRVTFTFLLSVILLSVIVQNVVTPLGGKYWNGIPDTKDNKNEKVIQRYPPLKLFSQMGHKRICLKHKL